MEEGWWRDGEVMVKGWRNGAGIEEGWRRDGGGMEK